jgi:hypothetical protein
MPRGCCRPVTTGVTLKPLARAVAPEKNIDIVAAAEMPNTIKRRG